VSAKKRVLVLFCGGTIIMKKARHGGLEVPSKAEAIRILRAIEPRLSEIADFRIRYVENIDSTNMTPGNWDRIIGEIGRYYRSYDGFVITHGTDTMAYTAAALSLGLGNLGKPVVLTGSQIPGWEIDTDARRNLVNAMKLAVCEAAGVYVVFDERVIRGSRASKASESKLDAFTSVNAPDAGEIRVGIRLDRSLPRRRAGAPDLRPGFASDIFVTTLVPGADPGDLIFLLDDSRIRGIVIQAYGTGNVPYEFDAFFRLARKNRVPVVVTSQCLHGMTQMKSYDVGRRALKLGVIEGFDQSLEMLTVKLMWALERYPDDKIREVMTTNFAGELDMSTQA
jgi:L-asparaginase